MTKIKALHAQGASAAAIVEMAHTDPSIHEELIRLLERNLGRSDDHLTLSSQARYAMRLSSASTAKDVRHSEL